MSEKAVLVRLDRHPVAGLEAGQRRLCGVDLVAEDPEVPGGEAAVLAAPQAQHWQARCPGLESGFVVLEG